MNVVESLNFAVALFNNFQKTTDGNLKLEIFIQDEKY